MLCYVYVFECTYRHTLKNRLVKTELTTGLLVSCQSFVAYSEVIIGHSSQTAANEVI